MNWIESIRNYIPYNKQEEKDKELFVHYIEIFEDVLSRDNEIAHITCSALVINKTRDKMLMVHHNIYNSWSWIGGHADGDADFLKVAMKEAMEETGIKSAIPLSNDIFALDIMPVVGHYKRGKYISAHIHLSLTYVFEAGEDEALVIKRDENSGVMWVPLSEVNRYSAEAHMHSIYNKLTAKLEEYRY
ncbi:MAG: NUDIX hydrolase [Bacillota bacterium]